MKHRKLTLLPLLSLAAIATGESAVLTNSEFYGPAFNAAGTVNRTPDIGYNSAAPTDWNHWGGGNGASANETVDSWGSDASTTTVSGLHPTDGGEYYAGWRLGYGMAATPTGNGWVGMRTNYHYDPTVSQYFAGEVNDNEGMWQQLSGLTIGATYSLSFYYANAGNGNFVVNNGQGSYSAEGRVRLSFLDSSDLGGSGFTPNNSTVHLGALAAGTFAWDDQTSWQSFEGQGSQTWIKETFEFVATEEEGFLLFSADARATNVNYHSLWDATYGTEPARNAYMGITMESLERVPEPSSSILLCLSALGFIARRKRS